MRPQERDDFENPIYSYTARQAVEDGVLIELEDDLRREAGYRWPVRITPGVQALVTPTQQEARQGQSLEGRLWDVLFVARIAIQSAQGGETLIPFEVSFSGEEITLWACLDTTSGAAIHIILPEEY
jgi:hypothetical protein